MSFGLRLLADASAILLGSRGPHYDPIFFCFDMRHGWTAWIWIAILTESFQVLEGHAKFAICRRKELFESEVGN